MAQIEVFDPRTGETVHTFGTILAAARYITLAARSGAWLDWARAGEGWL